MVISLKYQVGSAQTSISLFLFVKSITCVTPRLLSPLTLVCSSALQAGGGTPERKLVSFEYGINYLYVFFNSTGKIQSALKTRLQENMFFLLSLARALTPARKQKTNLVSVLQKNTERMQKHTIHLCLDAQRMEAVTQNHWEISQLETHTLLWLHSFKLNRCFLLLYKCCLSCSLKEKKEAY